MVIELRTYTSVAGRLDALHARFRDHTMRLFEKHGMTNILYMTPMTRGGDPIPDTLVYLLAHESIDAAKKSFDAFRKDAEWLRARDESEADGRIVMKLESQFFTPAEYSPSLTVGVVDVN